MMSPIWKEKRHTGEDRESQFKQRSSGFAHSFNRQGAIPIKGGHGLFSLDCVCDWVCVRVLQNRAKSTTQTGFRKWFHHQAFSAEVKKVDQSEQENLMSITEASSSGHFCSGMGLHLIGHLALIFKISLFNKVSVVSCKGRETQTIQIKKKKKSKVFLKKKHFLTFLLMLQMETSLAHAAIIASFQTVFQLVTMTVVCVYAGTWVASVTVQKRCDHQSKGCSGQQGFTLDQESIQLQERRRTEGEFGNARGFWHWRSTKPSADW